MTINPSNVCVCVCVWGGGGGSECVVSIAVKRSALPLYAVDGQYKNPFDYYCPGWVSAPVPGCLSFWLVVCLSWLVVCPCGWVSVAGYLSFWLSVQLSVHVSGFCPEDISWSHPIFYNQTWYGGGASSWGRVLCEKIGLLSYFVSVAVIEKKAGGGGGWGQEGGKWKVGGCKV